MIRKKLCAALAAVCLAMTACGSGDGSASSASAPSADETTAPAVSLVPAAAPVQTTTTIDSAAAAEPVFSQAAVIAETDIENYHEPTPMELYGRDISQLQAELEEMIGGFYGEWSVYVKHLGTGETMTINECSIYAASLIKMYCMACIYQEIENGNIDEKSVQNDLEYMITISSDDCFNTLARRLGIGYINSWCEEHGYTQTFQCHGLGQNYDRTGLDMYINDMNRTSVEDCGHLLEAIYNGECVSKGASGKMLSRMLRQTVNGKIPTGLPEGTPVAHKTGDTNNHTHDCAIVFSPDGAYILCIMSSTPSKGWDCNSCHRKISEKVYSFFNPETAKENEQ